MADAWTSAGDVDLEAIVGAPDAPEKLQKLLVEASQNGDDHRIHLILDSDVSHSLVDVNSPDGAGSPPLMYAACYGHEAAVAELLRDGADPNARDQNDWTALMWAVNNNHVGIVRSLLAQGASLSEKTPTGRSATDLCVPGSAVYLYLTENGYLSKSGDDELYKRAEDPDEADAKFAAKLEESTQTLGLSTQAAFGGIDIEDPIMGLTAELSLQTSDQEFDWDTFRLQQSFGISLADIPVFLDLTVSEYRPTLQRNQVPVSANCLFLAARYLHYCSGPSAVLSLLSPAVRRIRLVVDEQTSDLACQCYWLAQAQILLYYFQRDRGMREASSEDIQPLLRELVHFVQHAVLSGAQRLVHPLIQPCLLDFENIPGIRDVKYRDGWNLFHRHRKPPATNDPLVAVQGMLPPTETALRKPAPRNVTSVLSSVLLLLQMFHVHPVTIAELYAQIFYWIAATMFNSVVLNRRYLARCRAMQIRLNVSALEDWARNNDFRPIAVDEFPPGGYKSLLEIGRANLAPFTQMLQWLQCFSGFGQDFTTVVAALQELKALNPKQLLYAAKKYRVETNEPVLSREYRNYLAELAAHYEASLVQDNSVFHRTSSEHLEKSNEPRKSNESQHSGESPASGAASNEDISNPESATSTSNNADGGNTDGLVDAATARISGEVPKPPNVPELASVDERYQEPRTQDITMDASLELPMREPTLKEGIEEWGGGYGGIPDRHPVIPTIPADIVDAIDEARHGTSNDVENEVDTVAEAGWNDHNDEPEPAHDPGPELARALEQEAGFEMSPWTT